MPNWIFVVDDDMANLKMAGHILSRSGMRVTAFRSGEAMLKALPGIADSGSAATGNIAEAEGASGLSGNGNNTAGAEGASGLSGKGSEDPDGNAAGEESAPELPDLVLLDVMMPGMDGLETLTEMRKREGCGDIPVIFLTAEEDPETETKGLKLGAMDYIRKPFVPDVLVVRVQHTIELVRLQRDLAREVEKKTAAIERLSLHIVETLAEAIDAKDTYTHGHSKRVAEYSEEIARRFGYSEDDCRNIYVIGLLHDVGKIGIPDAVINKPGRLTDEEYDIIKTHPPKGARILGTIDEMPGLATGANWHHERYDGKGYPDGLKEEDIPEMARIIAVADAYDAMTSCRSYRGVMAQEKVREQIESGKGTQFDPVFADIMLEMIDEDKEYTMHE